MDIISPVEDSATRSSQLSPGGKAQMLPTHTTHLPCKAGEPELTISASSSPQDCPVGGTTQCDATHTKQKRFALEVLAKNDKSS